MTRLSNRSPLALAALAGCLSCAASAHAQNPYNPDPFGPIFVQTDGNFQSFNLSGPGSNPEIGTYSRATITLDWSRNGGSGIQFQNDSRIAIVNANFSGVPTIPANITTFFGGPGGSPPTTAASNQLDANIRWDNVPFTTPFVRVSGQPAPLVLAYRTARTGGGPVLWSNINVTISPAPVPPPFEVCTNAIDLESSLFGIGVGTTVVDFPRDIRDSVGLPITTPGLECLEGTPKRYGVWYRVRVQDTDNYTFQTSNPDNSVRNNIMAIYQATDENNPCDTLMPIRCSALNGFQNVNLSSTVGSGFITLTAGTTYYVLVARATTFPLQQPVTADPIGEQAYVLGVTRVGPLTVAACGGPNNTGEVEPNDNLSRATPVVFNNLGDSFCGTSTGSASLNVGATSLDYFSVKFPAAPGIRRQRVTISTSAVVNSTSTHTLTSRSLRQDGAANSPCFPLASSDQPIGSAWPTFGNTPRSLAFYTLGNSADPNDRTAFFSVAGSIGTSPITGLTTGTLGTYTVTWDRSTLVTPTPLSRELKPGSVTILSSTMLNNDSTDTKFWVLDSSFNPIPGYGNDDFGGTSDQGYSGMTRTFAPGTYYLAIAPGFFSQNLVLGLPSPADDDVKDQIGVFPYPGVLATANVTAYSNRVISFFDTDGRVTATWSVSPVAPGNQLDLERIEEVAFFRFDIASPTVRCNPA
ncbi:MAG: hypothetical protein K2X32_11365, partial [Phycisphaerales bacterium]|nr:hypothetical protein [Phycisphaerales bacterium]